MLVPDVLCYCVSFCVYLSFLLTCVGTKANRLLLDTIVNFALFVDLSVFAILQYIYYLQNMAKLASPLMSESLLFCQFHSTYTKI